MTTTPVTFPDSHLDLLDGPHTATIITIGPDQRPQASAVWFLREGDTIKVSITTDRQKYRNLVARPGVGFFLLDPASDQRYIEVRGDAEITPDPDKELMAAVVRKHGVDPTRYLARDEERVVVTITPTRVVTLAR